VQNPLFPDPPSRIHFHTKHTLGVILNQTIQPNPQWLTQSAHYKVTRGLRGYGSNSNSDVLNQAKEDINNIYLIILELGEGKTLHQSGSHRDRDRDCH